MKTTAVFFGVLATALTLGSQAHAQSPAWLPDRAYKEGPGIRVGDLELHPGVAVRGGYDSNVFRADGDRRVGPTGNDVTQRRRGSGILAVTPHLYLSTLSQQRRTQGEDRQGAAPSLPVVAFRGGASATYFHYFLDGAPKNFEVDTDFWLGILPSRPFNLDVTMAYARNIRPFTQFAGPNNAYSYDTINPRLRANFGSRSQVLTGYVGYVPRVTLYESSVFNYLNNVSEGIEAGATWRFLPSTALVYDSNVDLQTYQKDDASTTRSPVLYANNVRFRTRAGINGAITRLLSVRALAGYALMRFSNNNQGYRLDDHETVVAEAALTWHFGAAQASSLEFAYNRDIQSSPLGGWIQLDRGSAVLRALLGRVFLLSLEAGAAHVNYGSMWGFSRNQGVATPIPLGANNNLHRNDVRLDGAVRGEYRITDWLALMGDFSVQAVLTDFQYAVFYGNSLPVPDPARYFTLVAFGGLRAHY